MTKIYISRGTFPAQFFQSTVDHILDAQMESGCIPWFAGGHADPWDHVEAAMGLSIAGEFDAAKQAYLWLKKTQLDDGSWWAVYRNDIAETCHTKDARRESNFVAYVATGVWHHYLISKDRPFLEQMWKTVEAAINFVLRLQHREGDICWAVNADGTPRNDALVTGCSSIYKSLECALQIADTLNISRPEWYKARSRLGHTIKNHPERFDRTWESKERYSMDWFYPVLAGVFRGNEARKRLQGKWHTFVEEEIGCRCVSDEPWVTVAESCELTMSLIGAGEYKKASTLFSWLHDQRDEDGVYWTGYVFPDKAFWPIEKPTWTGGAILLAADALAGTTSASRLFTSDSLLEPADDEAETADLS